MSISIYCKNCGKQGHLLNKCKHPILSCGVLLYRDSPSGEGEIEFLMVNRKYSYGFSDFMMGSYAHYNIAQLQTSVNEMSESEKKLILNEEKWINHWNSTISKSCKLSNNLQFSQLVFSSSTNWESPEWEFPKGRRKLAEWDNDCALREFEEETGIPRNSINVLPELDFIYETFMGSNGKQYTNKYLCAKWNGNVDIGANNYDYNEIGCVKWIGLSDVLKIIRPYNKEKIQMINDLAIILNGYNKINFSSKW
jgi:8-oxo-dGTP pyrophosphatase MutT (NUDIX family)